MAAKELLFEGTQAPELTQRLTAAQKRLLDSQMAACPGCVARAWQRTPKGYVAVEIALPGNEFMKFSITHRADLERMRIERRPESASEYQQRADDNPRKHQTMLRKLRDKRRGV